LTTLGWTGVALLIVGFVAMVVEGALAAIWGRRLSRKARELQKSVEADRALVTADVARLRLALEETKVLWQPYRRALRWLRHPLTFALIQSFARRWSAAR
jgi:hypothetical protein